MPQQQQQQQPQQDGSQQQEVSNAHSPQSVGREFVRQYYTLLNQGPLLLHRFYSSESSFVHGGMETETSEPVKGQQAIHQKIKQLNFRDCHAKIRQFDAHSTLGNGVVVQVSGELSNNGQEMRKFMQTFVLAPQSPKKYFVMNDIFRYQDEVFGNRDQQPSQQQQPMAASPPSVSANQNVPFVPVPPGSANASNSSEESGSIRIEPNENNFSGHSNANSSGISIESGGSIHNGSLNVSMDSDGTLVQAIPDVMPTNVVHGSGSGVTPVTVSIKESLDGNDNRDSVSADEDQQPEPPQQPPQQPPQPPQIGKAVTGGNDGEKAGKKETTKQNSGNPEQQQQQKNKEQVEAAPEPPAVKEPLSYANRVKSGPPISGTFAPPSGSIKVSGGPPPNSIVPTSSLSSAASTGKPESVSSVKDSNAGNRESGGKFNRGGGSNTGNRNAGGPRSGSRNEGRYRGQSEGGDDVQERKRLGPQNSVPFSGVNSANNSNSSGGGHANYPDTLQLFVGNLPHNCTEGQLEDLFSKFGKVAEIRISSKGVAQSKVTPGGRVPNFGFVVFENETSVGECLRRRPIFLPPNDHRLNVEEKKNKHQIRSENSGNFNHRGGSFERGSQEQLGAASGGGSGNQGGGRGSGERPRGSGNSNRGGSSGRNNSQQQKGSANPVNTSFRNKKPPIN